MFSILSALFGFVLTPAYKDYKKSADVDNALQNALVELLYKSGSTSYDGFAGPYAALDYIFNDVKPLAPSTSLKLIGDLWKAMVGEKTWMNIVYSNAPIFRAFKDTAKISNPDTFKKPNT